MFEKPVFAITGDAGAVGGRVAARLAASGRVERLIVCDPSRVPDLPRADVASAAYADLEPMRLALSGIEPLFMVSSGEAADSVRQRAAAVDAAVAAGVERIVYLSFLAPRPRPPSRSPGTTGKPGGTCAPPACATRYCATTSTWTCSPRWPASTASSAARRRRAGAVARDNVADMAVAVLLGESHDGHVYDVTGPDPITLQKVVEKFSRFSGCDVVYHPETLEEPYASHVSYGAPE